MSDAYKQAGVNIEAGYEAVERMKKHVKRTERAGIMGAFGGFGGMFDLSALNYKEPVLISGTDGVGTKLKLAFAMDKHDTIGVDCVAMCVNDIAAQGAEPLYFLDYLAVGKAEPEKIEQLVKGIADACVDSGCALIGGETAEMPGMYEEDEYDMAGFAVGAAEKSRIITGEAIQPGDVLIGLPSSGIHSNGFSLVRKVLLEQSQMQLTDRPEGFEETLGEVLLTPTRLYPKAVKTALAAGEITGMAHITGGGFYENLPRMLPEGTSIEVNNNSWPVLPVFDLIQKAGDFSDQEMFSVFNMGIGFVFAVRPDYAAAVQRKLADAGEESYEIGHVTAGSGKKVTIHE
ncbi:phosphoribosylformylglycinamidine cyclo-ligase [Jeotgalibacillus haloalkalitolerans]|uniref:Phosphoribosylformylglycinamidine cyclo-ligase n=1 Tax=Jeotgalibacillus haloalkalitolerans TaxID=3104292 RepID=A0ABU5KQG7_9BACL|nr:phosphoribosylformylglycinamidine cyclo-ligase [Jeotgalibacillus sp. HH7-29]MDZ5713502.1 phosphoribosylformylglycinamidine cyclo-ligase [Jeotgalibacillus sp. HH7-29]